MREDLTGKVIHPWRILSMSSANASGNILWLTECVNCGCQKTNTLQNIEAGYGCRNCSLRQKGQAGLNKLFGNYKSQAKKSGRVFELMIDEFKSITSSPCHYCGSPPSSLMRCGRYGVVTKWGDYVYNGIDRMDNDLGYISINCAPCCWRCNRTFGDLFVYVEKLILAESLKKIDLTRRSKP